MPAIRYTFSKNERLKREQHIDALFRNGEAFSISPIRFVYQIVTREANETPMLVGFSVPKKRVKSAVKRNSIKRKMLEGWRINKHMLIEQMPDSCQLRIFLIFIGSEKPDSSSISSTIIKGIDKLVKKVSTIEENP